MISKIKMNGTSNDMLASENQFKFMQERIGTVEKHFGEMCHTTAAFARNKAKVRDKGDAMCKSVLNFAETETLNRSTRHAMCRFADILAGVQDYQHTEVLRLDAKVVQELSAYGNTCKLARDDLKASFDAKQKELLQKKRLDRVRNRNPMNRQQISQAEIDLQRATSEAMRYSEILIEQMDSFEKKKLHDIKKTFLDFAKIEMSYHAKALELFTKAYENILSISEEEDLEEFRNCLRVTHGPSRMESLLSSTNLHETTFQSTSSMLNRTNSKSRLSMHSISSDNASATPLKGTRPRSESRISASSNIKDLSHLDESPEEFSG